MSKEADDAFDKWYLGKVLNVGVGDAFRAGWAEKQRRDLAAVEDTKTTDDELLEGYDGRYQAGYGTGHLNACDEIAARIKGGTEGGK